MSKPRPLALADARRLWLRAQRLDVAAPFGAGPAATRAAVEHLGYVQIDTINVVERAHHHILWSRIPAYARADLGQAQAGEKSVFEYWAHALAYIPTRDYRHFIAAMRAHREKPAAWFGGVTEAELAAIVRRIRRDGALSIRDIDDEELVDKTHPWASRKPSKRVLQHGFFGGQLTVSARAGMVKTYELSERHFGWPPRPRVATEAQTLEYLLDRALRAQGVVSLESACYMDAPRKKAMAALIEARVRRRRLVPVAIDGLKPHWAMPEALAEAVPTTGLVHVLSPFDPLVIQRTRLEQMFGHAHRFEAYVPAAKRRYGYFALPVLVGDRVAAVIDTKADRAEGRLLVQQWSWIGGPRDGDKAAIEDALQRFEAFQFGA
ncbi:MAG: crosslink repair DNA glycosylase YcaQ family protein [Amaricoccus sp.]|uniref:winged helix-turn-helix domain-containing protein n=1 Tax=Amaricoccus sp. TaxID=1872485 RepID=UPI0039E5BB73